MDNRDSKIKADSVLLLSLLAERTCSPATAGASRTQGQTEHKCLDMCVCLHWSNHYDRLPANTPICHDKRVTQEGRWMGRQTSSYSQKKKEEEGGEGGEKKKNNNTVYFITWKWEMSFVNKWPIYFPSHQWTHGT